MFLQFHRSAIKHGIAIEDIEHAVNHAMCIDDRADGTRLYLGSARNADLLEVSTITRPGAAEVVIHAMQMRPKYRRILPRGE
jgi:hypothetical protein